MQRLESRSTSATSLRRRSEAARASVRRKTRGVTHGATRLLSLGKNTKHVAKAPDGTPLRTLVVRRTASVNAWRTNLFGHLMNLRWSVLMFLLSVLILLISLIFMALYAIDSNSIAVSDNQAWGAACFLYSLSITTTLGNSPYVEVSSYSQIISNVHMIVAQLMWVFVTGLVFSRLSQPKAQLVISERLLLSEVDSALSLHTRIILTGDPPELLDTRIDLTYRRVVSGSITSSQPYFARVSSLTTARPHIANLKYMFHIRHIIDETSPLYNKSLNDLLAEDASFELTVFGLTPISMQPVFTMRLWSAKNILVDQNFKDITSMEGGEVNFYHERLNQIYPAASGDTIAPRSGTETETEQAENPKPEQLSAMTGKLNDPELQSESHIEAATTLNTSDPNHLQTDSGGVPLSAKRRDARKRPFSTMSQVSQATQLSTGSAREAGLRLCPETDILVHAEELSGEEDEHFTSEV